MHVGDIDGEALSPAGLAKIAALNPASLPAITGSPRLGPCVVRPLNFICIGLNYADPRGRDRLADPEGADRIPEVARRIQRAERRREDPARLDQDGLEVELGIVIGTKASYVPESASMDYVAGYCVVNDVSEREYRSSAAAPGTRARAATRSAPPARGW